MKIIMSFWSLPYLEEAKKNPKIIDQCLFLADLSVNALRKKYSDIELVTDDYGAKIFSNFKFSKIRTDLNDIHYYNIKLWAVGKIYALSLYDEPVCHLDMDFIVKDIELFDKAVSSDYDLIVQSVELYGHYQRCYKDGVELFMDLYLDDILEMNIAEAIYYKNSIAISNCGVIGFKNIPAKKDFTEKCLRIYRYLNNRKRVECYNSKLWIKTRQAFDLWFLNINCIAEQVFLTTWALYNNFYVKHLIPICEWPKKTSVDDLLVDASNHNHIFEHFVSDEKKYLVSNIPDLAMQKILESYKDQKKPELDKQPSE